MSTAHNLKYPRAGDFRSAASLIRRIAENDEEAVALLYDESHKLVYSIALRILGNVHDAEEVTVDVFLQIWRQSKSFDPDRGKALAWIATMARSRAIDRVRALSNESRVEPLADQTENKAVTDDCGPEKVSFRSELAQHLKAALYRLNPNQRIVIEHAFFRGLSHSEISRQLDLPLGTVKQRIRRGVKKLREYLPQFELNGWVLS